VVVTIPVPQFLRDITVSPEMPNTLKSQLEMVKYSTRFALICFYESILNFKNGKFTSGYNYNGLIRYWSVDNQKRNVDAKQDRKRFSEVFLVLLIFLKVLNGKIEG
jgi:predicted NAD/FAD-dependent oxidoreductase